MNTGQTGHREFQKSFQVGHLGSERVRRFASPDRPQSAFVAVREQGFSCFSRQ
jgi:hypothetical protein